MQPPHAEQASKLVERGAFCDEWNPSQRSRERCRAACPSSRRSLHVLPRDDRLQLLFSHFCRTQISLVEKGLGECRSAEISSLQIRTKQNRPGERSPAQISSL